MQGAPSSLAQEEVEEVVRARAGRGARVEVRALRQLGKLWERGELLQLLQLLLGVPPDLAGIDPLEDLLDLLLLLLRGLLRLGGGSTIRRGQTGRTEVGARVADGVVRAAVRADGAVIGGEVPEQARGVGPEVDPGLLVAEDPGALGEVPRVGGHATSLGRDPWPGLVAAGLVAARRADQRDSQGVAQVVEEVERVRLDVGVVEKPLHSREAGVAAVGIRARRSPVGPLAGDRLVAVQ